MENVIRYTHLDNAQLVAMTDDNGFLYDCPIVARSGVYTYVDTKGNIRKEYRPEDVVFDPASLATFEGKPIVVDHPKAGCVKPETAQKLTVGSILSKGFKQEEYSDTNGDKYVACKVVIYNPKAMGERRELSLGYTCDCVESPGTTPNGEQYSYVQSHIKVNHLAIVKKARAGSKARLHADGNEYLIDADDEIEEPIDTAGEKTNDIVAEEPAREETVEETSVEQTLNETTEEVVEKEITPPKTDGIKTDNAPQGVNINPSQGETKNKEDNKLLYRIDGVDTEVSESVYAHINALQTRLDACKKDQEVAEKEKNVAQAKQEVAEDKLAQLQADCDALKKKVADAISAKEEVEAKAEEDKKAAAADKNEALAEKDEEIENEKNEKAQLEDKLDSAENNIVAMKTILEKAQSDMAIRKDSFDELSARFDSMSAELEQVTEERDSLQARLDAAIEEKEQAVEDAKKQAQAEMEERAELEDVAKKAKVDGAKDMSNEDLKKAIIKSVRGKDFDFEGKSKGYLDGAFDAAKESLGSNNVKAQMKKVVGEQKEDSAPFMTAAQRRQEMIKRQLNAYNEKDIKF